MFRGLKETLEKVLKVVNILLKVIPTLLDILEDLSDDGKRNNSNEQV